MYIINILNKPFPVNTWRWYRVRGIGFGLFVCLFLFLFKPFRLDLYSTLQLFYTSAMYGVITGAVILTGGWIFIKVAVPRINEEKWTLGWQIFLNMILMIGIAICNVLVTQLVHNINLPFWWHLNMLKWVLMLGFFPIAIAELFSYNYYLQQHVKSAALLAQQIPVLPEHVPNKQERLEISTRMLDHALQETDDLVNDYEASDPKDTYTGRQMLILTGENQSDKLTIPYTSLLAVQALDNYVNVFWEKSNTLQTTMLRNTLTNISEQLIDISSIYRSHRGWLVNTQRVSQVEGNAQGLKLSVDLIPQPVPVSRANIAGYRQVAEQHLVMQH